jgi:hypothetical protein
MKNFFKVYRVGDDKALCSFSMIDDAIRYFENLAKSNTSENYYVTSRIYGRSLNAIETDLEFPILKSKEHQNEKILFSL